MATTTRRKPSTPAVPTVERLAEQLAAATRGASSYNATPIALCAAAAAVTLLGAPTGLLPAFLTKVADDEDTVGLLDQLWKQLQHEAPFLDGHLRPLLSWMDGASPDDVTACRQALRVLAGTDLVAVAKHPAVGGELLGPLYTFLRSTSGRRSLGAFYTPMSVSQAMASMMSPAEGQTMGEPSCGTGGMMVALARDMRLRGLDAATCAWVLNDLDATAVALAGVNAVVHGFGQHVTLRCGDGLTLGNPEGPADD